MVFYKKVGGMPESSTTPPTLLFKPKGYMVTPIVFKYKTNFEVPVFLQPYPF